MTLSVQSKLVLAVVGVVMTSLWQPVTSHGRLWTPPGRSTMFRRGYNTPHNYDDNGMNCGGFAREVKNGYKCGICGDPWDIPLPRPTEAGGKFATGKITGTFKQGQTTTIQVEITANHKGWFDFKLCPTNDYKKTATQECLDEHVLQLADGSGTKIYVEKYGASMVDIEVKLPENLSCDFCVLQWHYHAGNSWGTDPDGKACVGCGPQEEFYGCADIKIAPKQIQGPVVTDNPTTKSPTTTTTSTSRPSTTPDHPTPSPSSAVLTKTTTSRTTPAKPTPSPSTRAPPQPTTSRLTSSKPSSPPRIPQVTTKSPTPDTTTTPTGTPRDTTIKPVKFNGSATIVIDSKTTHRPQPSTNPPHKPADVPMILLCSARHNPGTYEKWCNTNCNMGNCPASLCKCGKVPDPRLYANLPPGCYAKTPFKDQPGMDDWCTNNCLAGVCQKSRCLCLD